MTSIPPRIPPPEFVMNTTGMDDTQRTLERLQFERDYYLLVSDLLAHAMPHGRIDFIIQVVKDKLHAEQRSRQR